MTEGLEFVKTGAILICSKGVVPAFFRSNPLPRVHLSGDDHGASDDKVFKDNIQSFIACKTTKSACTGSFDDWDLTFDPKINNYKSLCFDSCIGCSTGGGVIGFATHGQVYVSHGTVAAIRQTAATILPTTNPMNFNKKYSPIIATTNELVALLADMQAVASVGTSLDRVDLSENPGTFAGLDPQEWSVIRNEGRRKDLVEMILGNETENDSKASPYSFGSSDKDRSTREQLAAIDAKVKATLWSWSKSTEGEWAVLSEQFALAGGRVELSALGLEAKATVNANFEGLGNFNAGAHLAIEAYVFKAEFDGEYELGPVEAGVQAEIMIMAAAADAGIDFKFDPMNGDIKVDVGVEGAIIILGANGKVSAEIGGVEAEVGGEVGVGLGGEIGVSAGLDDWAFTFDTSIGAWVGIGGSVDFGFTIDVKEVGGHLVDGAKAVGGAAQDAGEFLVCWSPLC